MAENKSNEELLQESNNTTYLSVSSAKTGKRILLFFMDAMISFFVSLFFFSLVVFPTYGHHAGYFVYHEINNERSEKMVELLYQNKLYEPDPEDGDDIYDFTGGLRYDAKLYLVDKLKDEHQHDYFRHYYKDIKGLDTKSYLAIIQKADTHGFFAYTEEDPVLKAEYKKMFAPLLDEKDTLAKDYEDDYQAFTSSFFASSLYAGMISDLEQGNVPEDSPLKQYSIYKKAMDDTTYQHQWDIVNSVLISWSISSVLLFLIVPLITRRGRTLSMLLLRKERVDTASFKKVKIGYLFVQFLYLSISTISLNFFTPMLILRFAELFSLPYFLIMALLGLIPVIVSFFFLLFDSNGQSALDLLTHSVILEKKDYDRILKAREKKHE